MRAVVLPTLIVVFLSVTLSITPGPSPASAQLVPFPVPTLEWQEPILGPIGSGGLFVADIDSDGREEIVAGSRRFFWQVLRYEEGRLKTVFHSPVYPFWAGPLSIHVHQADDDDFLEILYSTGYEIEILDGRSLELERTLPLPMPGGYLALGDIDDDGSDEVVVKGLQLAAYDLATGALEWTSEEACGELLSLGQADEDPALEIVASGYDCPPAFYDGATGALEGSFPEELGNHARFADLIGSSVGGGPIGDSRDELIFWNSWNASTNQPGDLTVFDLQAAAPAYVIEGAGASSVEVFDVDGDSVPEVVYSRAQGGRMVVADGATGAEEASLQLPSFYPSHAPVVALAFGDPDGDGRRDLVWADGSPGALLGQLEISDLQDPVVKAVLRGVEGPFHSLAAGDVDGDGERELVRVTIDHTQTPSLARYQRLALASREVEYTSPGFAVGRENEPPRAVTANVDGDPQEEVFLGLGTPDGAGELRCFDGRDHAVQWSLALEAPIRALQVADVDQDGDLELIVRTVPVSGPTHTGLPRVHAVDAATGALAWMSEGIAPSGEWAFLRVGELDGSPGLEILLFSGQAPVVLDAVAGAVETTGQPLRPAADAADTFDADGDGVDEVFVATYDGLERIDPSSGEVLSTVPLAAPLQGGLEVRDFDGDGTPDFLYGGQQYLYLQDGAFLDGGAQNGTDGALIWQSEPTPVFPGTSDGLLVEDIDGDRRLEIVVGTYLGIWAFELPNPAELFRDGFESGDVSAWESSVP